MATTDDTRADVELAYLLQEERLSDDSPEMDAVRDVREFVEQILFEAYGRSEFRIRYGGSKAKRTMMKCAYDLDLLCYFDRTADRAGSTLEEIYHDVRMKLEPHFEVHQGRTALRLGGKNPGDGRLGVDVVPGRYVDESCSDVWLHQNHGDKQRLRTNPQTHIEHVRDSGARDHVCLAKLWRKKRELRVRQFPFELLCIDVMSAHEGYGLAKPLREMFEAIAGAETSPAVIDPANPSNNLASALSGDVWTEVRREADQTLLDLNRRSWSDVLRAKPEAAALSAAVAASSTRTQPWKP